jgi:ABC-type transport system substrate-binding protein
VHFKFCFWILFLLSLVSCWNTAKQESKSVLSLSYSTQIPSLDPAVAYDEVSIDLLAQIYEPLYEFSATSKQYEIIPLLASALPVYSNDHKTLTISLKKNVHYHPNPYLSKDRVVEAQDLINSIKRVAFTPNASAGLWLFEENIKGLKSWRSKVKNSLELLIKTPIEGLEAPNPQTLIIHLNKPSSEFIYALTMIFTAPTPTEILPKQNEFFQEHFVGTGPFLLEDKKPEFYHLIKNNHYHETGYPKVSGIHFKLIPESSTRWLEFQKGLLDITSVPKDFLEQVFDVNGKLKSSWKAQGISSQDVSSLTLWWLSFNLAKSDLKKDIHLREAIAYAIDTQKLRKLLSKGLAKPMTSLVPETIPGHAPFKDYYRLDLVKAKEKLLQSDYYKKPYPLTISVRSTNVEARQQAEFLQLSLKAIGVDSQIKLLPLSKFIQELKLGSMDLFLDGWSLDYPDPANVLQLLWSKNKSPGSNNSNYSNATFDGLYEQFIASTATEDRANLLMQMQNMILKDLPWIPLMWTQGKVLTQKNISGYVAQPLHQNKLKYISVNR